MPNNYLSVLYKHIIQVENKNVGLKVCVCVGGGGGHKYTIAPNQKIPPLLPPPASSAYIYVCVCVCVCLKLPPQQPYKLEHR